MIGIIKISTLMTASVNYWPGFVAYTKIILLTYCNDKSKNSTKNHYYIRTQVEILFANVLIFWFIRNMGSSGCEVQCRLKKDFRCMVFEMSYFKITCAWNFCTTRNTVHKLTKYWPLLIWNMIDFANHKTTKQIKV